MADYVSGITKLFEGDFGYNLRWPKEPRDSPRFIAHCATSEELIQALSHLLRQGLRPTIKSGGHCYEDFWVNNPGGGLLDLTAMSYVTSSSTCSIRIGAGTQMSTIVERLHRLGKRALPTGLCGSVAAGGFISGGGYGLLSRLYGLASDWVSSLDVVVVDENNNVAVITASPSHHCELFRACLGGGGGNFGAITAYHFETLPAAPDRVIVCVLLFDWNNLSFAEFHKMITEFGEFFSGVGQEQETWGLFAILNLRHLAARSIEIVIQFCEPNGHCEDLNVLFNFIEKFRKFSPLIKSITRREDLASTAVNIAEAPASLLSTASIPWIHANEILSKSAVHLRAKQKSAFMKRCLNTREISCIYHWLRSSPPGLDMSKTLLAVDSYGGAINAATCITSAVQRSSTMLLQYQSYWNSPEHDRFHLDWIRGFYSEMYGHDEGERLCPPLPIPGPDFEGCYINYPDADLRSSPNWGVAFYGTLENYQFLSQIKRKYDPCNMWTHSFSIS